MQVFLHFLFQTRIKLLKIMEKWGCGSFCVFIILKNVLLVDSSKHDMIDASSALCPFLSRHVLMLSCLTAQI